MPIQRHPNCKQDRCKTCLEDATTLTDYLFERTGLQRRFHDMLGEYRRWLDINEIPAESPTGWPMPEVYQRENVDAFVKHMVGEEE